MTVDVVERAISGDLTVSLTPGELHLAWRRLEARGRIPAEQIAAKLGVSRAQVVRWRCGQAITQGREGAKDGISDSDRTKDIPMAIIETPNYDGLIAAGERSPSKRVQAAARSARQALAKLTELMRDETERLEAAAEVERLEAEYRAAKERLRKVAGTRVASTTKRIPGADVWAWAVGQGMEKRTGRPPKQLVERYRREVLGQTA